MYVCVCIYIYINNIPEQADRSVLYHRIYKNTRTIGLARSLRMADLKAANSRMSSVALNICSHCVAKRTLTGCWPQHRADMSMMALQLLSNTFAARWSCSCRLCCFTHESALLALMCVCVCMPVFAFFRCACLRCFCYVR